MCCRNFPERNSEGGMWDSPRPLPTGKPLATKEDSPVWTCRDGDPSCLGCLRRDAPGVATESLRLVTTKTRDHEIAAVGALLGMRVERMLHGRGPLPQQPGMSCVSRHLLHKEVIGSPGGVRRTESCIVLVVTEAPPVILHVGQRRGGCGIEAARGADTRALWHVAADRGTLVATYGARQLKSAVVGGDDIAELVRVRVVIRLRYPHCANFVHVYTLAHISFDERAQHW